MEKARIVFCLFLFLSITSLPQEKHFIYFKDKGVKPGITLNKLSAEYRDAVSQLSARCVERRMKHLGSDEIISFEDIPIKSTYVDELENLGIKIENKLKWFNAVTAYLTVEQLKSIKLFPFVLKVEKVKTISYKEKLLPDGIAKTSSEGLMKSNGLDYGLSFTQLELSGVPAVHSKGITGKGVLIGILDTGFDWKRHESLMNANVVAEYDFIFKDSVTADEPQDAKGQDTHGTYCFSIIAGKKDSALIGAAFEADFILAKTEDIRSEKNIEEDNYAAALEWMENYGVDITSSSLGYNEFDAGQTSYTYANMDGKTTIVTKAAELAFSKGVLTVTSAGNEGNKTWKYITAPADGFNTIAVGAVNAEKDLASFSSIGPTYDGRIKPDVTAMGVSVVGAISKSVNQYNYASGTSSAAPIASGLAALLLSAYPELNNIQLRDILLKTADNYLKPDNKKGYGLISAYNAINHPVILFKNNEYILNKIAGNSLDSIVFYFSSNGVDFEFKKMVLDSSRYIVNIPVNSIGNKIYFYFENKNNSGVISREPANNSFYYSTEYGKTIINIEELKIPSDFLLEQNFPNPFNQGTKILFYSPEQASAEIVIYDILGQKVKTIFKGTASKGLNQIFWDGKSNQGMPVSTGIYLYALKSGENIYTKKMLLLR
ncbi:MAG TPA: S8 family serine peptidase [Ignavibacteriaceae bacterium]|nr:S8 family serine peptidase [Ignavibacteriaceae bacterium]